MKVISEVYGKRIKCPCCSVLLEYDKSDIHPNILTEGKSIICIRCHKSIKAADE